VSSLDSTVRGSVGMGEIVGKDTVATDTAGFPVHLAGNSEK